ncbi:MAG: PEPxxWA-CTERM sorting domain-containing protein [Gemmatimonas sp.]
MKRSIFAALIMCAAPLHAQYLQNEQTATYSLRTILERVSPLEYHYKVQFRNEQAFDPNRYFGLTELYLYNMSGYTGQPGPYRYSRNLGPEQEVGSAFLGPMPSQHVLGGGPLTFSTYNFSTVMGDPNTIVFSSDMPGYWGGFGLMGCSAPVTFSEWPHYSGSTCAAAGFTGWKQITIAVTLPEVDPTFDGSMMQAKLWGKWEDRATFDVAQAVLVTPEPSTWALLLIGLTVVGFAARRRIVFR